MAKITWSSEAKQRLSAIFDYIAEDNPAAAWRVTKGIRQQTRLLIEFPEIGFLQQTKEGENVRVLLYRHYRITYFYDPESDRVEVLGVFHGALDIDRHLP